MLARAFAAREIQHVRLDVLALPVRRRCRLAVKDRGRECSRLDVLALPVEWWRALVCSEDWARVFGCPHGAEGVEVARGAPGEIGCPGGAGGVAGCPSRIEGESAAGWVSWRCRWNGCGPRCVPKIGRGCLDVRTVRRA